MGASINKIGLDAEWTLGGPHRTEGQRMTSADLWTLKRIYG